MVTAQWAMPYVILPSREMYQNHRSRNPQGCGKTSPNLNNRVLHDQLPVAALVRAQKTRFKPMGWASASGSGAQSTARPTKALRLCAFGQRLARGHLGRRSSTTGTVARLPTRQMVTARTHKAMRPRPLMLVGTSHARWTNVSATENGADASTRRPLTNFICPQAAGSTLSSANPIRLFRLSVSAVKNSTRDFVVQYSSTAYVWHARAQAALNSYGIWHMCNCPQRGARQPIASVAAFCERRPSPWAWCGAMVPQLREHHARRSWPTTTVCHSDGAKPLQWRFAAG